MTTHYCNNIRMLPISSSRIRKLLLLCLVVVFTKTQRKQQLVLFENQYDSNSGSSINKVVGVVGIEAFFITNMNTKRTITRKIKKTIITTSSIPRRMITGGTTQQQKKLRYRFFMSTTALFLSSTNPKTAATTAADFQKAKRNATTTPYQKQPEVEVGVRLLYHI